jgi:ankyrin repeat protein
MNARNTLGQTILFEAIARDEEEGIISAILASGVNVASRDSNGMTARDLAVRLQRHRCVRLIDSQVLKVIKSKALLQVSSHVAIASAAFSIEINSLRFEIG